MPPGTIPLRMARAGTDRAPFQAVTIPVSLWNRLAIVAGPWHGRSVLAAWLLLVVEPLSCSHASAMRLHASLHALASGEPPSEEVHDDTRIIAIEPWSRSCRSGQALACGSTEWPNEKGMLLLHFVSPSAPQTNLSTDSNTFLCYSHHHFISFPAASHIQASLSIPCLRSMLLDDAQLVMDKLYPDKTLIRQSTDFSVVLLLDVVLVG